MEEAGEEGDIRLFIPILPELDLPDDASLIDLAKNSTLVDELEKLCASWEDECTRITEEVLPTRPKTFTPLAELEMWRERNSILLVIYDQLQSNEVRKVLLVLNEARSSRLPSFQYQKQEVFRNLQEARDITRFLTTIERHLKTLSYSTNFGEMTAALPHIMDSLQLVWMLSRHYNKDERMGTMLQMIARLLYDRVTALIHPKVLFLKDPLTALDLSDSAKTLFMTWKSVYMSTRDRIEQSGKGARWEFDRSKLFPKTDYCAVIAQHLSEIACVLLEFQNFFGPEIKQVIGDFHKVDNALKNAYLLVKPFVEMSFDPFLSTNGKVWAELLEQLRTAVKILEAEAKSFIDEAFVTIKSAAAAFQMLMNFKHIETRDGIHAKLMKKFDDTLMIYIQEVRNVREYFEKNKENPTLQKNVPSIAGRIWWVRALFYHIKGTILVFRTQNDVINSELGQMACQEYFPLAREMKQYEDTWYQKFCDVAQKTLPFIRKNIFIKVPAIKELGQNLEISQNKEVYKVNLPYNVMKMIQETQHFEQMGYRIPESVRNIAFQRNQYIRNSRRLDGILKHYYQVRRNLRPAETLLMEKRIREMEKNFDQGVLRLNWNALGIPDYAAKLTSAVQQFDGIVNEVNKVAKDVRVRLWIIKKSKLYLEPPYHDGKFNFPLFDCWDFFQYWERYRIRVFEKLLLQFIGLPPLFLKLETLIYGSSTGKMKQFRPYFKEWENRIFYFMSSFIIRSLYDFEKRMSAIDPLFSVNAILQIPDIRLNPTPHELYNMVMAGARDCVFGTKKFPRWLRGTCLEAQPVSQGADKEKFVYSYFLDIGRLPRILQLLLKIENTIQGLLLRIWDHLKKYRKFKNLWRFNKEKTVTGFALKNPPVQNYDDKMGFYMQFAERVEEMPSHRLEGCIRINLEPLHASICRHAREWVTELGAALAVSTKLANDEFERITSEYERELFITPRSVQELKRVFLTLQRIQDSTVEMEGRYHDLNTRYAVLKLHRIDFSDTEAEVVDNTWKRWQLLWLHEVKVVNKRLEPIKRKFKKITALGRNKFREEVLAFVKRYYATGPGTVGPNLDKGVDVLARFRDEFKEMERRKADVANDEKLFGLDFTLYPELVEMGRNLDIMDTLFKLYLAQKEARATWSQTLWGNLNPNSLVDGIEEFLKEFKKLPKEVRQLDVAKNVEEKMKEFKRSVPLLVDLKHEALRPRHWEMLMKKTGIFFGDVTPDRMTLGKLFLMELHRFPEVIAELIACAIKELYIEKCVKELTETWDTYKLNLLRYLKNGEDRGWMIGPMEDMMQLLDDHTVTIQGISSSRFVGPFLGPVSKLEKMLSVISEVMETWFSCQRKWMYLEGVFSGGDIRAQLAEEAKRFDGIDKKYRIIMADAVKKRLVKDAARVPHRLKELRALIEGLDKCQKFLNEYLETKRHAFPRFFFISDDELLSILGTGYPSCIQEHMIKMFDNVAALKLVENRKLHLTTVHGMVSAEMEEIEFRTKVLCHGRIEEWMNDVVDEMKRTNRFITKKAVFYYGKQYKTRVNWMLDFQGMVVLAANQVWWTAEVENVFIKVKQGEKRAMKEYLEFMNKQLDDLVVTVRTNLKSNDRKKYNTSLIIDVHARDIIDAFVRDSIVDDQEFEWESQLRFYWLKEVDGLIIKQCTGTFSYGYEYMGLNGRLVITPLTDRIYLTITQALSLFLGGAPAGPAGTGKTETTKDLAKALGLLCVVTNCGENMDYKAVGTIFMGLCQVGAWGCFDEFNRIDISVLSVISTQVQTIRNAIMQNLKRFVFDGIDIKLEQNVGIFITMNPGYAGRTELPESVKALFRPVVCIIPDLEMICLIMLFSEGFLQAKVLAKKMTVLYKLAKGQLSKQHHYDFGLRALKSVLVMAGELKRNSPELDEDLVLMRALRDMNLPKFVYDDVPLFLGLIQDLFPGLDCPRVRYPEFNDAVESALLEEQYIVVPDQVDKVVQLYETMMTRHTTMTVGPSGGGKSVVINALCKGQTNMGIITKLYTLNPKAISVKELYGDLNPATRDWTDGLLSNIFREINRPTDRSERRYIHFDGDVDALWVENMNSVMDDNKLLTLPNGERIRLQKHCALLFEVGDLQYASPATVSRAGMVYVDPKNLGYEPYWKRWVAQRSSGEQEQLNLLYEKYIVKLIDMICEGIVNDVQGLKLRTIVPLSNLNMVVQLCVMLDAILPLDFEGHGNVDMEMYFLEAIYFSLGAGLIGQGVEDFDTYVRELSQLSQVEDIEKVYAESGQMPTSFGSLQEYFWMSEERIWKPWVEIVPPYQYNPELKFSQILIPTKDCERATWFLTLMAKVKRPVVLIGSSGTSKTATCQTYANNLSSDNVVVNMNFSSRTSSMDVQRHIESNVEKRTKYVYGPPHGKRLIVFVDDMNMPQVDSYGTQQPIALLRLLMDRGGMYDRGKDLNWKQIRDIGYMACMGKAGGGRNEVDPRFISLFSVLNMSLPSNDVLFHIFSSILKAHVHNFTEPVQTIVSRLTRVTLKVYGTILKDLPPTPSKFHYVFNLRDISRVYCGLCQMTPERFSSRKHIVRVWRNEMTRVFSDRLVSKQDKTLVNDLLEDSIEDNFEQVAEYALRNPLLFGDYQNALNDDSDDRVYEDILEYANVKILFEELLINYNEVYSRMQLVLFDDALEHVTRISRAIRMHKGHCLLVGVGGNGRQSLTKLASYAAGYKLFEITLSRGYSEYHFREDLKKLYNDLGLLNKQNTFLLSDAQIVEEGFLELINNMLANGMVPALYSDDEKENIVTSLRDEAKKHSVGVTKEAVWQYFIQKCVNNLHIVLAMTPTGDALQTRCRSFPGLVNNTYIDWFQAWPRQALFAVATVFFSKTDAIPEKFKSNIVKHVVHVHISVQNYSLKFQAKLRRLNFVSPKHYLDYMNTYVNLYIDRLAYNKALRKRLADGVTKIADAKVEIEILNKKLKKQEKVLAQKTKACAILLEEIGIRTVEVKEKKEIAIKKGKEVEEQSKIIEVEKGEAEEILKDALPALERARFALDNLDAKDINELRSFPMPPKAVQIICECIMSIKHIKETGWKAAKQMMASSNFRQSLIELDVDSITPAEVSRVKTLLKGLLGKGGQRMTALEVLAISKAASGMLAYIDAVMEFCVVNFEVLPKKAAVKKLVAIYNKALAELEKINARVRRLEEELETLKQKYDSAIAEKQRLEETYKLLMERLSNAYRLIQGLGSENERWQKELKELKLKKKYLLGDCLLSSAFLSYTGGFSWEFRDQMIYTDWLNHADVMELPRDPKFRVQTILTDEVEVSGWSSEGLPNDEMSIQNGILTIHASRFPLCIDPRQHASNWIRVREAENDLRVLTFNDSDFLKQLELAIKGGFPVLVQDVEEYIDPVIDDVLEKNIRDDNGRKYIVLGDKEVDYNPGFRLYLNSKLANPRFAPSVFAKAMVVNYTVTVQGLEGQLLSVVVAHERPDLEEQRNTIIHETSINKRLLKDLEDSLLKELSESTGSMVDNVDLVHAVENAKTKADEVAEKLALGAKTAKEIEKLRDGYRPAAKRGAILFFVLADMCVVNSMYQYSLTAYLGVFTFSLKKAIPHPVRKRRLNNIIQCLTVNVYEFACMGIFERDKLLFSFQMATRLEESEGGLKRKELEFFIRGNVSVEKTEKHNPFTWISQKSWEDILKLTTDFPNPFSNLISEITENEDIWRAWYDSDQPEVIDYPSPYEEQMTSFQCLMLIRCFRVDRAYRAVAIYITEVMDEIFVTPPVIRFDSIYEQSTVNTPVVLILSPGSDPGRDLVKLVDRLGYQPSSLKFISLGQGQEAAATALLELCVEQGYWLMLQNCHLLIRFIREFEKLIDKMGKPHVNFRLWMTTDPTPDFPIGILQKSLKVVTEPPNGLKLNLRNTYVKMNAQAIEECKHEVFKPLVYVLAFFHAVLQERRKYGRIGYNIRYEFGASDFDVSMQILETYLVKSLTNNDTRIPWGSLKYLIGEVMYGGRVIDDFDRRIVKNYMDEYMGDFLFDENQPFHFYHDDTVDYVIPELGSRENYIEAIDELPLDNSPMVFGLHANAEIGYYTEAVKNMWHHLIELQPQTSTGKGGQSRDSFVEQAAKDILNKLPQLYEMDILRKKYGLVPSPTTIVLLQEVERFNVLIDKIRKTLQTLRKAIAGEVGMDSTLDNISNSLYNGKVPDVWLKYAPATRKPLGSWMVHFFRRFNQYEQWINIMEPRVLWLSGLHVPESYLTALIQATCRRYNWPLDKSTLYTQVTNITDADQVVDRPAQGCYVNGLYLEGARWDLQNGALARSYPKVLVEELPVMAIIPKSSSGEAINTYRCPVYTTSARRNAMGVGLVFEADLYTEEHTSHWVCSGVCLTLNTDD